MRPDDLDVGTTVPEMFVADLRLEYKVRAALCKGIALCELHKDYVSRDMLRVQLADTEEDHTYWLEVEGLIVDWSAELPAIAVLIQGKRLRFPVGAWPVRDAGQRSLYDAPHRCHREQSPLPQRLICAQSPAISRWQGLYTAI